MSEFIKTSITLDIEKILDKKVFFPVLINGPTGCGKTYPVMQLCKEKNIKIFPISITHLSDENTLIGSIRIKDGTTYFEEGPVISAMREGGVLLLDELDLAVPENIMCLQSIIDGKGFFIKQTSEFIEHSPGFTIIATANTKGLGDDTGTYIGTNILNEAFLERFIINFEADYMDSTNEKKILLSMEKDLNIKLPQGWVEVLVDWANKIRDTIKVSQSFSHNISTRRLIQIIKTYYIFGNARLSVIRCLNRFDEYHKKSFLDMYTLLEKGKVIENDDELNDFTKEYGHIFDKIKLKWET